MESGAFISLTRTPPLPVQADRMRDRDRLAGYRLLGALVLAGFVLAFAVTLAVGLATTKSSAPRLQPLAPGVRASRLAVSGIGAVPAIPGLRLPPKTVKRSHAVSNHPRNTHSVVSGRVASLTASAAAPARTSTPASTPAAVRTPSPVVTPVRPSAPPAPAREPASSAASRGSISTGTVGGGSSSAGTVSGHR